MTTSTEHRIFRELSNPIRLKIVDHLSRGRLTYPQLVASTGESVAAVAYHLLRLTKAGAVYKHTADRRTVYCILRSEFLESAIAYLASLLTRSIENDT